MAWKHESSRHERGYDSKWVKLRLRILRRDDGLCTPCRIKGRDTAATQVDHIIPKSQDGTDDWDNLQSICDACHKDKTAQEATGRKPRTQYDAKGFPIWD